MTNFELKNNHKRFQCFNCESKIYDAKLKQCPNCGIVLDPNHYIKWRISFFSCVCLLCLIPILIAIFISFSLN